MSGNEQGQAGIFQGDHPAWMNLAVKLNKNETGRVVPRSAEEEALERVRVGETFKFVEVPGNGEVSMAHEVRADARGTQVAMHPDLVMRLKQATLGLNFSTAMFALTDYALDRLDGYAITFTGRDADKSTGPLVTWKKPEKRGATKILWDGPKMPVCPNPERKRVPTPLDVRRRVERVKANDVPFTHASMALAWWALDDLKKRKIRLLVPHQKHGAE